MAVMRRTVDFLIGYNPSAIVVASNVASITLMDDLKTITSLPLFGVLPPLKEALATSQTGKVGIMGVQSMIESIQLRDFVTKHTDKLDDVALINASPMVDLVESGAFLFDSTGTSQKVTHFIEAIFDQYPAIDVLTLSSTHLPWLLDYFSIARPDCQFLDPAEDIVDGIGDGTLGSGTTLGLVTESQNYRFGDFRTMLSRLRISIPLQVVTLPT